MTYLLIAACGWLMFIYKVRRDFKKAHERYNIIKCGDNWVVRDSKGRFVTITANYWNICKLGA
nr:MAG: hypothetical protein [Bacteriophage sp.]